jgi:hypothetical protein
MTCEACLAALATESLREMTPDSAVMLHCATCPDCARVTTTLREREYEAATVLNSLPPMSNPLTVAETAVRTAQRRRLGRVVVMLTGAALVATIWIVAATILIPILSGNDIRRQATLRTETMQLSCLSPNQAADIINPYVRKRGSTYYIPSSGISAITVRGTPEELAKSRELILHFERDPSAACHVPTPLAPGKSDAGSLLGKRDKPLLDLGAPSGSGPVTAPDKVPAVPKK